MSEPYRSRPPLTWARLAMWSAGRRACHYCGRALTKKIGRDDTLTVDHRIPRAKGGRDKLANFVPACSACNNAKADMTEEEFLASRRFKAIAKEAA